MKLHKISSLYLHVPTLEWDYQARWVHKNKRLVVNRVYNTKTEDREQIEVSRWKQVVLNTIDLSKYIQYEERPGFFEYSPVKKGEIPWYLNFANQEVFVGYGDQFLAQDELQCLEHPVLGLVREALVDSPDFKPLTVEDNCPTPILVTNVKRRCEINTTNLYGNRFATASPEKLYGALRIIDPPTKSNIIAIEAPHARGKYSQGHIRYILTAAVTGFAAAVYESKNKLATIHTGFWGCGAYGGNSELMALLQLLAAKIVSVPRFVFYTGSAHGHLEYKKAFDFVSNLNGKYKIQEIIDLIYAKNYMWGVGNGT